MYRKAQNILGTAAVTTHRKLLGCSSSFQNLAATRALLKRVSMRNGILLDEAVARGNNIIAKLVLDDTQEPTADIDTALFENLLQILRSIFEFLHQEFLDLFQRSLWTSKSKWFFSRIYFLMCVVKRDIGHLARNRSVKTTSIKWSKSVINI